MGIEPRRATQSRAELQARVKAEDPALSICLSVCLVSDEKRGCAVSALDHVSLSEKQPTLMKCPADADAP